MSGFKENDGRLGVYAYLTASANTTVTTGGTFVPIAGTFANDPINGFSLGATAIVCDSPSPLYYEIDWHATASSQDAGRTVHMGIAINGAILTTSDHSVMGIFMKYAGEALPLSGTLVVELSKDDTIQLQITSDTDADVVTVSHYTTTIRRFY